MYLNTTSRLAVGAAGEMPDGGEGGAGAAAAAAAMECGTLGSQIYLRFKAGKSRKNWNTTTKPLAELR